MHILEHKEHSIRLLKITLKVKTIEEKIHHKGINGDQIMQCKEKESLAKIRINIETKMSSSYLISFLIE